MEQQKSKKKTRERTASLLTKLSSAHGFASLETEKMAPSDE
jgi:hypothetical protein